MRLSTRAILFSIGLTTVVITAVFVTLSIEIRNETKQLLQDILNRSEKQVLSIQQDNLSQLLWASSQISSNATLRAAMETYRLESTLASGISAELLATVQNELDKVWAGLRHDLLFVTNETGVVLAANGRMDSPPRPGEDLSQLPVLKHALNPSAAMGKQNFGVINLQGQHFLIGTLPIEMQGFVIGSLSLGDRIDSSFLPNLRAFFGGDTMVTVGQRSIASTLPPSLEGDAGAEALARLGAAAIQPDGTARLGDEDYLITSMMLGTDESGEPVTLFLLRSLTQALKQPNGKLKNTLAKQAVLAILLGALLTWGLTRTSLRPLERFAAFMKGVAESGDYSRRFQGRPPGKERPAPVSGEKRTGAAVEAHSTNELDLLVNGFNNMLAVIETRDRSLKQAHTELEQGIRALHQKEEELRQSQKMEAVGLLAGGVAHDFNNILMVVSGFSELALRSLDAGHEARACIEEVQKAAKSASLLTRQLLAIGRKQVFRPKVINLNNLISELEKILRTVIGESIELTTQLDANLHNVLADPSQIEQVLLNLTLNSKDAIAHNGTICIATANAEPHEGPAHQLDGFLHTPHVVISVSDSGCGMDKTTQARMFEPFYTTKDQGKGTGLGLSTVHGIVKQSGGHIRVESEPGHGTVIRIYLPRVALAIEKAAPVSGADAIAGTETILVVEDEPDVRRIVCKLLTTRGYNVLEASGPIEALTLFKRFSDRIDLLLTDIIMPVMNGRQLYEQIALLQPGIKTLFISGYTNGVINDGGTQPGDVNFLQKPFAPDELTAKVRMILYGSK
jgi:signal transduction histidine kinase